MQVSDRKVARKFLQIEESARGRGIDFTMTLKRIRQLLNTKTCYFTGRILNTTHQHPDQLTFDRIDNSKGYTDDNVVVCAYFFNLIKGDLSVEHIDLLYKGLKKKKILPNAERKTIIKGKSKLETTRISSSQIIDSQ